MKIAIAALFLSLSFCGALGQDSAWHYTQKNDELHGKTLDKFILDGKYLTHPSVTSSDSPSLVISCFQGKVEQNYVFVGAVVDSNPNALFPVMMEARIDGKHTTIPGDGISTSQDAVFFTRADLKKVLKAHRVILGVQEFSGPEVVMQFDMPTPVAVLEKCGRDRMLHMK